MLNEFKIFVWEYPKNINFDPHSENNESSKNYSKIALSPNPIDA